MFSFQEFAWLVALGVFIFVLALAIEDVRGRFGRWRTGDKAHASLLMLFDWSIRNERPEMTDAIRLEAASRGYNLHPFGVTPMNDGHTSRVPPPPRVAPAMTMKLSRDGVIATPHGHDCVVCDAMLKHYFTFSTKDHGFRTPVPDQMPRPGPTPPRPLPTSLPSTGVKVLR